MSNNLYKSSTLYDASGSVKNIRIELDNVKNLLSKIHSYDEKNLNNLLEKKEIESLSLNLEETSILMNALNYYLKKEENDKIIENMTMINYLVKNNIKKMNNKSKSLFRRAEKISLKERLILLNQDINKITFSNFSNAKLAEDITLKISNDNLSEEEISEIIKETKVFKKNSWFENLKYKLHFVNSTRIGKLYFYEKIYAYSMIIFNHLTRRK